MYLLLFIPIVYFLYRRFLTTLSNQELIEEDISTISCNSLFTTHYDKLKLCNTFNTYLNTNFNLKYKLLNREYNIEYSICDNLIFENEHIKLSFEDNTNNKCRWNISNKTNRQIKLISFEIFITLPPNYKNYRIFQNGYQSWSPSGSVEFTDKQIYITKIPFLKKFIELGTKLHHDICSKYWNQTNILISNMFTLIKNSNHSILFGFDNYLIADCDFIFKDSKQLIVYMNYQKNIKRKESIITPYLFTLRGANSEELLDLYSDIIKTKYSIPELDASKVPVGWCSWYEYYTDINEKVIINNVSELIKHDSFIRYIQIDNGYENKIGDWIHCNKNKFKKGFGNITKLINSSNIKAGIWLAPFIVGKSSSIFKNKKRWLLKDNNGKPIIATYNPEWKEDSYSYCLDLSQPEVKEYLYSIFQILKDEGFNYFKLDFLAAGHVIGNFYNKDLSRTEVYREAMNIIRNAVGDDSFILGCGAPLAASIGLVDGMRVSPDVSNMWEPYFVHKFLAESVGLPCVKYQLKNSISRQFIHRKWWLNDPDVIVTREHDTHLTIDEFISQITIIGILGGSLFFSDDLQKLSVERINIIKKFTPPTLLIGKCIDFMNYEMGKLFILGNPELFIFNYLNNNNSYERTKMKYLYDSISIYLKINMSCDEFIDSYIFFDFWNNSFSNTKFTLESHCSKTFQVIRINRCVPQIVGNTLNIFAHVDGRITESFDVFNNILRIQGYDIDSETGSLWITIPDNYNSIHICNNNNCGVQIKNIYNKIFELEVSIKNSWLFEILLY
jgi:alpha-galactosidase